MKGMRKIDEYKEERKTVNRKKKIKEARVVEE
jgi:hypothetical protein